MTEGDSPSLSCVTWNVHSLNNKVTEVMEHISDYKADIVFLTETWQITANNSVTAAIKDFGYTMYHKVRNHDTKSRAGGVGILCSSNIDITRKNYKLSKFSSFEYAVYSMKSKDYFGKSNLLLLVPIYRDQYIHIDIFIDEFTELLQCIMLSNSSVIISGDFNVHWGSGSNDANKLNDVLESFNLLQHVTKATNKFNNILDLVISNNYSVGSTSKSLSVTDLVVDDVSLSDHFLINFKVNFKCSYKKNKTVYYRHLRSIDPNLFRSDLVAVLNQLSNLSTESFATKSTNLESAMLNLIEQFAPLKKKTIKNVPGATWFNHDYVVQRRKRRKAQKKAKRSGLTVDHENFLQIRKETTLLSKSLKRDGIRKKIADANGDQRKLYSVFNNLVDKGSDIVLPDHDCDEQLANHFSDYFVKKIAKIQESFNPSCTASVEVLPEQFSGSLLTTFEPTSVNELRNLIQDNGIKCSSADVFPPNLISDNLDLFLPVWTDYINTSFKEGSMVGLKMAYIKPHLKDSSLDHNDLKNYRPVSNLPFLSKLIERVVLKRLNTHMERNNLFIPNQSGYKKGHSTETLLIKITNDLLIASDKNTATVLLLLDLSAAFDTVNINKLLDILFTEIGIRGQALAWFKSFLTGRTSKVKIGNSFSEEIIIEFGVPQGSVLGPILFNIYIRSFYRFVNINSGFTTHGFADDHQLYTSFSPDNQLFALRESIVSLLDSVKNWMNTYFLKLNKKKTNIIVFTPPHSQNLIKINGIFIDDKCIRFKKCVENLGVLLDSNLTLKEQVSQCVQSCYMTIKQISNVKSYLDTNHRKVLVTALVLSKLDYCNGILHNIENTLLSKLQKVQNCAAKLIFNRRKYDSGLSSLFISLHWLPLRKRIVFKILLLVHKCLYVKAPLYLTNLIYLCDSFIRTGNLLSVKTQYASTDGAFSVCAPQLWNTLPVDLKFESSTVHFKRKLKSYLFELS